MNSPRARLRASGGYLRASSNVSAIRKRRYATVTSRRVGSGSGGIESANVRLVFSRRSRSSATPGGYQGCSGVGFRRFCGGPMTRLVPAVLPGVRARRALVLFIVPALWAPHATAAAAPPSGPPPAPLRFAVSFPKESSATPLDGRLLVMLSTDPKDEPRLQINDGPKTQQIFGIDVDGLRPGKRRNRRRGRSRLSAREPARIPPGTYRSRPCSTCTRRFTAATGTSSSCRWTAAKASSGTRLRATSTGRREDRRSTQPGASRSRSRSTR